MLEVLGGFSGLRHARLLRDRRAVTAVEYAILAAVLGLVLMAIFSNFEQKLSMLFTPIDDSVPRLPTVPPAP